MNIALSRSVNTALLLALWVVSGLCAAQHTGHQVDLASPRSAEELELEAQQRRAGLRAALKTEAAKDNSENESFTGRQLSPQERAELRQQIRLQPSGSSPRK
jgi:hypothetical protein